MPNNILHNAYTNTPQQHPNLILGSLQLMFWLFFRPAAWRNHLKHIDPALVSLSAQRCRLRWPNSALFRLLIQGYILLPLLTNLMLGLLLWVFGEPVHNITIRIVSGIVSGTTIAIVLSIFFAIVVPRVLTLMFCVGLGVAFGIVFGEPIGVLIGAAFAEASLGRTWHTRFNPMLIISTALLGTSSVMTGVTFSWVLSEALGCKNIASNSISGTMAAVSVISATVVGASINLWRPVLFYPFQTVWNTLIYIYDERFIKAKPSLLRWHSAFWDELQFLPLILLDKHLLLISQRKQNEILAACKYLIFTHQYWAAESVVIELFARLLERCANVKMIAKFHRRLVITNLESPARLLPRIFNQISKDVDDALNQEQAYNQRLALRYVANNLDTRLQIFTSSKDKYAVRFNPIAQRWRQIVAKHLEKLATNVDLNQEIDSPYTIGNPLTQEQKIFTGRTDIGIRIEQLLLDRRRPPLLLYGQRRMGKTSLLNNIGKLLPNSIIPMFVDLQGAPSSASDHAGFLYNLAKEMEKSAKKEGVTLPSLTREVLKSDPFTYFYEWLDKVEQALEQNTALLALDEFEVLDNAIAKGRFDEQDVLGMLRHLIQHRPRFKVLLAGSHTIEEYQRWASYLINVQVVHISYLKEAEARQLIERPVKDFTLRYEPNAVERVLQLTRCHPFLVQLLCAEIIVLKNKQDPSIRRLATLADVEAAIPKALQSGRFFFADIKNNQVDAIGKDILRFIAVQGEGAIVSRQTLLQQFLDADITFNLLLQRELIEEVDDGYRFQVELIRRWFV